MAPDVARPELRAYLLGVLAEARADALEARYVADPSLVEAIRDEEDALIADYLDDRLTAVAGRRSSGTISPRRSTAIAWRWRGPSVLFDRDTRAEYVLRLRGSRR